MAESVPTLAKDREHFSFQIVQNVCNCRTNKEFFDCCIAVDGETFNCHSFILESCSEFFRSRLTSNMKDKAMSLTLSNVSASIFRLILGSLYTGNNPLTALNIKDIWPAVHQLQILFLINLCEDFVLSELTLDNVSMYKRLADIVHSKRALTGILQFIIKHFSALKNTDVFLNLDIGDLKQIVESDDLVVESEDKVLLAIYEWVDSNKNERKKYLADLLQCTRYCLVGKVCIAMLKKHSFSSNDSRVIQMLDMASEFKVDFMLGFWPTRAIPRNCAGFEHVGVYCNLDDSKFVHFSLKQNKVVDFTDIPSLKSVRLAISNGKLFAFKGNTSQFELYFLEKQMWHFHCGIKLKKRDHKKKHVYINACL